MSTIHCKVSHINQVNDYVYKVVLSTHHPFSFKAGQYLQVVLSENDKRSFSIASAPSDHQLTLHIGASAQNSYAMDVIKLCQSQGELEVAVGLGDAYLREDSPRPVILVAGGTGFSYVQSIALHLSEIKPLHRVLLYWGGQHAKALYASDEMKHWADSHPNFQFIPVIDQPEQGWVGKTGFVHQAVLADIDNLASYDIYTAGHFAMIRSLRSDFVAQGALIEHMFSDAFAYI